MFLSLLSFRLTNLTGEIHNLTFLGGNLIKDYTKNHKNCVILFSDKETVLHFTKFAITYYKNITFARSSERDGHGYGCERYPCPVPFFNGRKVKDAPPAPYSAINFTRWCKDTFDQNTHYIEHPEALRQVLEGNETVVFGIGIDTRPDWIPKKFNFYMTNPKVFEMLKIKVENGLYSYSSKSRILHELTTKNRAEIGAYVSNLLEEKAYNKRFWGGFAINPQDPEMNAIEYDIMNDLGKKYSNAINLAPLYDAWGWNLVKDGRIVFFDVPFFFVFESHKNMNRRWVITNKTLSHDKNYVDNFIRGIINGSIKHSVINEDEPEVSKKYMKPLTSKTFWKTLETNPSDSLVIFTSQECQNCLKPRLVVNKTASLLRENPIKIYHFNCSLNEIPEGLDIGPALPAIALFKKGHARSKPLLYTGMDITEDLITWLKQKAVDRIDVPPFDLKKVREEIASEFYSLAPPVDYVVTKTETKF